MPAAPSELILRGARLRAGGPEAPVDIGIAAGEVIAVEPELPTPPGCDVLDVSAPGLCVLPGLIDFHVHVADGVRVPNMTLSPVAPDAAGVSAGVTTVVDAGSLGHERFAELVEGAARSSRTRVLAMLNVSRAAHTVEDGGDVRELADLDRAGVEQVCERFGDALVALKLRLLGRVAETRAEPLVREALAMARSAGLPLVVHLGDRHIDRAPAVVEHFAAAARAALDLLEEGDVISHICSPWPGGPMGTGELELDRLRAARERGVRFDVAMGRNHFSADVARRLAEEGLSPHILSTDMNGPGVAHHSLTEVMSKFLALGYPVEDVVAMVTRTPAEVLHRQSALGALEVGRCADLTVVELVTTEARYVDSVGTVYRGDRGFVPRYAVRAGAVVAVREGPHGGQWLPPAGPSEEA